MSQPTCAQGWSELLLALPEFVLTDAHVDEEHDELHAVVELPREVQACPRCGLIELHRVHDWRWHTVRHLPVAGRATRVRWHKRLLTCVAGCGTFVERTPSIAPGAVWSRAAARAAVTLSADNIPIDRIRKVFGVGWNTVMRAVLAAAAELAPVQATRVGIDETVMTTGRLLTRRREFLTALVCLETSLVVAVTQGRDRASAVRLLADHAPDAEVVALDLFSGFKSAADTIDGATVVADVFHLVRLALQALDEVRRRRQQQIHGHRGHKHDPLFRLRRVLRVPRNASTTRPGSKCSTGCGTPTPTTRSLRPGSPWTCFVASTPRLIATAATAVSWSSTSGSRRSTSPSSPGWPPRSIAGKTRCSRTSTPAPRTRLPRAPT